MSVQIIQDTVCVCVCMRVTVEQIIISWISDTHAEIMCTFNPLIADQNHGCCVVVSCCCVCILHINVPIKLSSVGLPAV